MVKKYPQCDCVAGGLAMLEKTSELVAAFVDATGLPASRVGNIARVLIARGYLPGAWKESPSLRPGHLVALMLAAASERVMDADVTVEGLGFRTSVGGQTALDALHVFMTADDEVPEGADFVSILAPYSIIIGGTPFIYTTEDADDRIPDRAMHILQYPSGVLPKLRKIAKSTIGYHEMVAQAEAEAAREAGGPIQ